MWKILKYPWLRAWQLSNFFGFLVKIPIAESLTVVLFFLFFGHFIALQLCYGFVPPRYHVSSYELFFLLPTPHIISSVYLFFFFFRNWNFPGMLKPPAFCNAFFVLLLLHLLLALVSARGSHRTTWNILTRSCCFLSLFFLFLLCFFRFFTFCLENAPQKKKKQKINRFYFRNRLQ